MHQAALDLLRTHPVAFSRPTDKRPIGVWPNGAAYHVASTDPHYRASLEDVQTWLKKRGAGGERLGILLQGSVCVFDLDINKGADPELVQQIIDDAIDAGSYIERSTSGVNVHIYIPGTLPGKGVNAGHLEAYDRQRYIIVTGNCMHDTRADGWEPTESTQRFINHWYHRIREMQGLKADVCDYEATLKMADVNKDDCTLPDNRLVQDGIAKFGPKFETLIRGISAGYESQSQADMALLRFLTILTDDDVQVARIFLRTPLGDREKAHRSDYLPRSIAICRATGDERRGGTKKAEATHPPKTVKHSKTPQEIQREKYNRLREAKGAAKITFVQNVPRPTMKDDTPQKFIEVMEYPDWDTVMLFAERGYAIKLAPEAALRNKQATETATEANKDEPEEASFLDSEFDTDAYYGIEDVSVCEQAASTKSTDDQSIYRDIDAENYYHDTELPGMLDPDIAETMCREWFGLEDSPALDSIDDEPIVFGAATPVAKEDDDLPPWERPDWEETKNALAFNKADTLIKESINEEPNLINEGQSEHDDEPMIFGSMDTIDHDEIADMESELEGVDVDSTDPDSIDGQYYREVRDRLEELKAEAEHIEALNAERLQNVVPETNIIEDDAPSIESVRRRFYIDNPGAHGKLPGNAHKIVEHFRLQSTRGNYDFTASALITVASGLAGRFYKIGRDSLTNYFMIVGDSGSGKSVVSDVFNTAIRWKGKIKTSEGVLASRPTSLRAVINMFNNKAPSFALNYNELASEIQNSISAQNTMRQNSLLEILKVIFDGGDMASNLSLDYAKKEDSTTVPPSPNMAFIGEFDTSVMHDLFSCTKLINDGTVARFNFVMADNDRNSDHKRRVISDAEADPVVKETFTRLWRIHAMSASENHWHDNNPELRNIPVTVDAQKLYDEIAYRIEQKMAHVHHQMCNNVMNRAYMRIMRIAGAIAVINNPDNPIVDEEIMLWAGRFVCNSLNKISYYAAMATLDISDRRKNFVVNNIRDIMDGMVCPEHVSPRYYADIRKGLVDPKVITGMVTSFHQMDKEANTNTGREAKALLSSLISEGYLTKELAAYTVMYRIDPYKMETDYPPWMERYVPGLRSINRAQRQVSMPAV